MQNKKLTTTINGRTVVIDYAYLPASTAVRSVTDQDTGLPLELSGQVLASAQDLADAEEGV